MCTTMDLKREKRKVMKNIIVISLSFLMIFNAFMILSRLQSSLHQDAGIGVINSSIIYVASLVGAFLVPVAMIANIGHKWSLIISFLGYIVWMAANGHAVWETMVPASVLVGVSAAPLWTAQSSYFTLYGGYYAKLTGAKPSTIITRFIGIFFCFFQCSNITGSIISSQLLKVKRANSENFTISYHLCGPNDCPSHNISNPNLEETPRDVLWKMLLIFIGISFGAIAILVFFLDPLPEELYTKPESIKKEIKTLLTATFRHLQQRKMILLIPITVYSGLEQSFSMAEFTKSYVSCPYGTWMVGMVTIPYGAVNAVASMGSAHLSKIVGRIPIFIAGLVTDLCIQGTLLFWIPGADNGYVGYILFSMWGFSDAVWNTQIMAFYGILFINDTAAAFANRLAFASIGFIAGFAYSNFICTATKLYITMSVVTVGIVGYLAVEVIFRSEGEIIERRETFLEVEKEIGETNYGYDGDEEKKPDKENTIFHIRL